ncbi:PREDICTED: putative BTB/POZ domain-containing protein At2g40440 [Tarenaya hassleriana]|uniref:putative BTB/POZ domain-containing protein At2g40440 n=1 Tax=Tarenaya hassleriana TaxID=28532 RepID=UPI00053CA9DF|nr:PREDICTED: putative BTB/POZ domain-containing protein At2g40440 [Tarenaya hassleriana]
MATQASFGFFPDALFNAYKEGRHADVRLKSGDGHVVNAHKLILSTRSRVFRDMLEPDECKTSNEETVTLSELKHEELEAFIEFMYKGSLPHDKMKQHVRSLYLASDKYDVPYLEDVCSNHLVSSLDLSNVLEVLELSCIFPDIYLQNAALGFAAKNVKEIALSAQFNAFVGRNPNLAVKIMQASLNLTSNSTCSRCRGYGSGIYGDDY